MISGKKGRVYGLAVLAVILAISFVVYRHNTAGKVDDTQQKKMPLVAVSSVQLGTIVKTIETTGTAEPENAVNIVPKIDQRITWMPLREGDQVHRGQLIVKLEDSESTDQLSAALADVSVANAKLRDVLAGSRPQEVRSAKAALAQAEANSRQAGLDLKHIRRLYGSTGIPEQQLQEAQSRYDAAQSNVESAKATVEDAELELGRLKKMLRIGGVSQEDVDKAQMRYQVTRSALTSANSGLASAKSNLEHVKDLNVKVIPEQQIDSAESKNASAQAALESAKARLDLLKEGASATQIVVAREQVRQARLKAETIRTQSEYCAIKSPVNGIITKLFLNAGDMAQTKQSIMSISENSRMVIKAGVSDSDAVSVRVGQPAIVEMGSAGRAPLKLKITRVYPSADPATRLVPIELGLSVGNVVSQGSFARVSLVTEKKENVVVIPFDAVIQKPGGKSVVFVVEQGKAHVRPIMTGSEWKGKVEIISGLSIGESLVVRGQEMLKDGVEVKVKPSKKSPGNMGSGMMKHKGMASGPVGGDTQ